MTDNVRRSPSGMQNLPNIGIDIVDIRRFESIRFFTRVAEYILTSNEVIEGEKRCDKAVYLASRFAVKEAVIKAAPMKLNFHDIEVCKNGEKPIVNFVHVEHAHLSASISLSHEFTHTIAVAIM